MTGKPWIVATGFSRGIGASLRNELQDSYQILMLNRSSVQPSSGESEHMCDLSEGLTAKDARHLKEFFQNRKCVGFLHCAGILGPVGHPKSAETDEAYWAEFRKAQQINFEAGMQLVECLLPFLLKETNGVPGFVMHLTSGAATGAYVGWEAYCTSKAALLSYFKILGVRFTKKELFALSIAPGRVQTDMMNVVLSSSPDDFPDVNEFQKAQAAGLILKPEFVAQKIADVIKSGPVKWAELHGKFYHFQKGVV